MLRELLFSKPSYILAGKVLDKAALAQRVIASNIAQAGTPGYQRLGVSFDEKLSAAVDSWDGKLRTTDPRHIPSADRFGNLEAEMVLVDDGYWNGINNVNIDKEMVDLAKNQLDFDIASDLMKRTFMDLRTAIRGRR